MKKICVILLVFILSCMSCAALAEAYVQTTGALNLRKDPGLGCTIIGGVPKGNVLTVLDSRYDSRPVKWYKVEFNGTTGWISSMYCKAVESPDITVTTTGALNLRKGGGLSYSIIGFVPKGTELYVLSSTVDNRGVTWYKTEYDGTVGWVSSMYCGSASDPAPVYYTTVTASTGSTYIRKNASISSQTLSVLPKGESALYLGDTTYTSDGRTWYHVKYNSTSGWVSSKYVELQ